MEVVTAMALDWSSFPPERLLHERFGMQNFHPDQREIIEGLAMGKRVLTIQRTGWGKSLCYQLASFYHPHLTLVFSPLKALMRDQCQRCNDVYHIPSAIVSSDFSEEENSATLELAAEGKIKILYIAPERLDNLSWQSYVLQMRISMIVVDEAHCISTWGHDFRPHYRRLVTLLGGLPANLPVLALTATANQRVEGDIRQQIGMEALLKRGSMRRPNLHLNVVNTSGDVEKLSYLAANLPAWPGSGIVYTGTQRSAEMVAAFLSHQGIAAEYYHAAREDSDRQRIEQGLMANHYKVVCSTNALGMGIDKPDIKFVVHYHIPASPIHYYQEIGRAGRDGSEARCVLLYDPEDLNIQRHFIQGAKPPGKHYEKVLALIRSNVQGWRLNELLRETGFSRNALLHILMDLEEQSLLRRTRPDGKTALYISERLGYVDVAAYEQVRIQKELELADIQRYTQGGVCFMDYLTSYLGDITRSDCGTCGNCHAQDWATLPIPQHISENAAYFIEHIFLPRIEKRGSIRQPEHEAGWALSYHGGTRIGQLVRASKYGGAGPFADELVLRAVEIIRTHYPVVECEAIVSVPPTKSAPLVEDFARRVANELGILYIPVLSKQRSTREQKACTNTLQKKENVKGAFVVQEPSQVIGRVFLLIDDIYDSGHMVREVGVTLMKAGARAVYPLTITKTQHSDDQ
jgi:ATP-dependent DNA helicase RecQ